MPENYYPINSFNLGCLNRQSLYFGQGLGDSYALLALNTYYTRNSEKKFQIQPQVTKICLRRNEGSVKA